MRLWSLHPKHLDARGLVALWREALLAQTVLAGKTRGYRKHPQLERFKSHRAPLRAIGAYLSEVQKEAGRRGYSFDRKKILFPSARAKLSVSDGQLAYEWLHLKKKLLTRDKLKHAEISRAKLSAHPIFKSRKGKAESWEKKIY
ncbi:MAG: pyrimidine dimer DNA glycosylase/endonuclease V [Candidatus Micrarchaeia archaeon]|jgi:hypothetical protein